MSTQPIVKEEKKNKFKPQINVARAGGKKYDFKLNHGRT